MGRGSQGRSLAQISKKGLSNYRWIVGGKLCLLLNQVRWVVAWDCSTAKVPGTTFHPLIQQVAGQMVVLGDHNFHAAAGNPTNLKLYRRRTWNERMLVETVRSTL